MSIRGTVTLECDSKRCTGSLDIEAHEWLDCTVQKTWGLDLSMGAHGWILDENGDLHCPQCCEEQREKNEDDGMEYGHPADRKAGIE